MQDCGIVVSEFKLYSLNYFHFQTNNLDDEMISKLDKQNYTSEFESQ